MFSSVDGATTTIDTQQISGAYRFFIEQAAGFSSYAEVWAERYELNELFQLKHSGSVSRSRLEFYSLGLGLALALDRLAPRWKHAFFEPGIWTDALLARALETEPPAGECSPVAD